MFYKTLKSYLEPGFLICAIVLAAAGGGMSAVIKALDIRLEKKPMPLKRPLELLDDSKLGQYDVISKQKITNEEVVEALGTREYIQWILQNKDADAESPVRDCVVFITYYDVADKQVAHVPDECYMGAGFQRLGNGERVTFAIKKGEGYESLPGKYVIFSSKSTGILQSEVRFGILYSFYVNGEYAGTREDARYAINKTIFSEYSYYSKVELKFYNMKAGQKTYPGKEEAIKAGEALLSVLLPILEQDHWPVLTNRTENDE